MIIDDIEYEIKSDHSCEVVTYKGSEAVVDVPSEVNIDGKIYQVTAIATRSFSDNHEIKKVLLPTGVVSIGDCAFGYCINMESIELPETIKEIGGAAFSGCKNLIDINIPSSVESLGIFMFQGCDKLYKGLLLYANETKCYGWVGDTKLCKSIVIPDTVVEISRYAFRECMELSSLVLPKSLTLICPHAFESCISLTEVRLPDNVLTIESYAFMRCSHLKTINVSSSTKYSFDSFVGCSCLEGILWNYDECVHILSH